MTSIRERRESLGLTQADLAARLGISRTTVTMWETEQNTPPTKMLTPLAEALGCTVDALIHPTIPEEGGEST